MKTQTLKGFRDFLPQEARKRQYVIDKLRTVFERFGFEPLETPTLEYEEVLTGKYGDEGEKLMYRFEDNGKRRVAMRYDQTVPTARVVAQYQSVLTSPFKRYQIQNVWRADNPQKGRYREFLQCDIDTIGVDSALADAEIVAAIVAAYTALGFVNCKVLINDRAVFKNLSTDIIVVIDKLKKIGKDGVCAELVAKKLVESPKEAETLMQDLLETKPTARLNDILENLKTLGVDLSMIEFSPTLARGLDYYTGLIVEIETPDYPYGSLCGGGRYNDLIGMFAGEKIPAVGLAVGFDRTIEAMESLNLFPADLAQATSRVLVSVFSEELKTQSLQVVSKLRSQDINAEIYLGEIKEKNPLEKQIKYANQKNISYLIIIGPEEAAKNSMMVKNLQTRDQELLTTEEAIKRLRTKI